MEDNKSFDVIIVGGSYAGLSAAMALGRSLRKVLIIDSGNPCNKQTPHSHNFLTEDGSTPGDISVKAKSQVLKYKTVKFLNGLAKTVNKEDNLFAVGLDSGETFTAKKILFATGVKDLFPDISGFSECWGISVLHCPYCHGYEVKNEQMGILGNGDMGFELSRLISNWTQNLTLYTNGKSTLTEEQAKKIEQHNIKIVEKEISSIENNKGYLEKIVFKDGTSDHLTAVFARAAFEQHCDIPQQLGCELTEQGYIKVDEFQKTNIYGIYAAGDNTMMFRAVSLAISAGTKAGAMMNRELIEEAF